MHREILIEGSRIDWCRKELIPTAKSSLNSKSQNTKYVQCKKELFLNECLEWVLSTLKNMLFHAERNSFHKIKAELKFQY